jgi:hypothetical protein
MRMLEASAPTLSRQPADAGVADAGVPPVAGVPDPDAGPTSTPASAGAQSISEAIDARDIPAIKAITNWAPATNAQRIQAIEILLDQFWVGPFDEWALEAIWASFDDDLPEYMVTHYNLWDDCVDRGAELPRWTPVDARILNSQIGPNVITTHQAGRVPAALEELDVQDFHRFRELLYDSRSDMEAAFLCKALAANHTITDIDFFAGEIIGRDEAWLVSNLNVVDEAVPSGGVARTGIAQQWQMSCGPTTVQIIHAQADPIYALSLHAGGDIHGQGLANVPMAAEQGAILLGHGSVPTTLGTAGTGAWVESDLNALSGTTGVTYTHISVSTEYPANSADGPVSRALEEIKGFLDQGLHVPLVIGNQANVNAHYVVAVRRSGTDIVVHDPGNGNTFSVTEAQFMSNSLPLSWPALQGYDEPEE